MAGMLQPAVSRRDCTGSNLQSPVFNNKGGFMWVRHNRRQVQVRCLDSTKSFRPGFRSLKRKLERCGAHSDELDSALARRGRILTEDSLWLDDAGADVVHAMVCEGLLGLVQPLGDSYTVGRLLVMQHRWPEAGVTAWMRFQPEFLFIGNPVPWGSEDEKMKEDRLAIVGPSIWSFKCRFDALKDPAFLEAWIQAQEATGACADLDDDYYVLPSLD